MGNEGKNKKKKKNQENKAGYTAVRCVLLILFVLGIYSSPPHPPHSSFLLLPPLNIPSSSDAEITRFCEFKTNDGRTDRSSYRFFLTSHWVFKPLAMMLSILMTDVSKTYGSKLKLAWTRDALPSEKASHCHETGIASSPFGQAPSW